jgi:RNA polymerase sigma-70 factor (ECF subfamily)
LISFDEKTGQEHLLERPDQKLSIEQQFDRQWASTALEHARTRLRQECVASGKSGLYDRLNLLGDEADKSAAYAEVARQLRMSISAIKSAVSRLRERYGELVREEIARTVSSPEEIDAEIQYLLSVMGA